MANQPGIIPGLTSTYQPFTQLLGATFSIDQIHDEIAVAIGHPMKSKPGDFEDTLFVGGGPPLIRQNEKVISFNTTIKEMGVRGPRTDFYHLFGSPENIIQMDAFMNAD
jgi:hypothetical protein